MSNNLIGPRNVASSSSASGVWSLVDQQKNQGAGLWPSLSYTLHSLVVAGGGGGGALIESGGGGGGGYRTTFNSEASGGGAAAQTAPQVDPGVVLTVTVGAGGAYNSTGSASSYSGTGIPTMSCVGGGDGVPLSTATTAGTTGGSGGGQAAYGGYTPGAGTANEGYRGGGAPTSFTYGVPEYGCGGGGAGAIGNTGGTLPGHGGIGVASTISGSSVYRAGGGGGGPYSDTASNGGLGGGGNSSAAAYSNPQAGVANTGGGSGGVGYYGTGQSGGSGVVILRMDTSFYSGTTTGSPTVSTSGSDTILVFNSSGSYTA
jgi:hypothetical protein